MSKEPLKLSEESVKKWALQQDIKAISPARICEAYGIDFELVSEVLGTWLDDPDRYIVNLAASACINHYIKAKKNNIYLDPIILCKAIEVARDNMFSSKAGISIKACKVIGEALDEFAQRKININLTINNNIINQIVEIAKMDGEDVIDIAAKDGTNGFDGKERPLLSCQQNIEIPQDDRIFAQKTCGEISGTTENENEVMASS